jgi:ketosteroid isomerase-like protein
MGRLLIWLLPAIVVAGPVLGDSQSAETERVVMQHLAASEAGDATLVPRDYAEDAVVIFGNRATTGVKAIQQVFADLYARTDMHLTLTTTVFEGSVGYVVWTKNNLRGSDTFIVRDGKIVAQTGVVFSPPSEAGAEATTP